MVRVLALQDHEYDSKTRRTGEIYDVEPQYVDTLVVLGRVQVAEPASTPPEARPEPEPQARRAYRRRDMKAEE